MWSCVSLSFLGLLGLNINNNIWLQDIWIINLLKTPLERYCLNPAMAHLRTHNPTPSPSDLILLQASRARLQSTTYFWAWSTSVFNYSSDLFFNKMVVMHQGNKLRAMKIKPKNALIFLSLQSSKNTPFSTLQNSNCRETFIY